MKKIHYLCLGLALVLTSCGKDDPNPPDDPTTNPPTIASFSPTEGTPGTTVEIIGTNFSTVKTENTVKFNGASASVDIATATKLTVSVPNGATSGKIAVTVDGETAQSSTDFTILDPPTISISGFTPDQENVGAQVVIEGENFDPTMWPLYFEELNGPKRMETIWNGLIKRGMSSSVLEKIMGTNLIRLYASIYD